MPEHSVPDTLERWLEGWQIGKKKGNPYRLIGEDVYVVYRRRQGWGAAIGKTHSRKSWPSADDAKVGIFDAIQGMTPGQLDRAHAGTLRQQ